MNNQKENQKENQNVYVDIHVLESVPPCDVDPNSIGRPQMTVYGGTNRITITGEAWEGATRQSFQEGVCLRPSAAVHAIANKITKLSPCMSEEKAAKLAEKVLKASGANFKDNNVYWENEKVFFISNVQTEVLAKIALEHPDENYEFDRDDCKNRVEQYPTIDQAIFGREVKNNQSLNCNPVVQVAQTISTHSGKVESELVPAVDDLVPAYDSESVEYEKVESFSATLYRYASVDVGELYKRIGGEAAYAIRNLVRAFLFSQPDGWDICGLHPSMVYVTIRTDRPINFVEAFKEPFVFGNVGKTNASVAALADYAKELYNGSVEKPLASYASSIYGEEFEELAEKMPLRDMLEKLKEKVLEIYSQD